MCVGELNLCGSVRLRKGKKGTNSELSNRKKCTPSQLEIKDEDVVLGEQSVIISKKKIYTEVESI